MRTLLFLLALALAARAQMHPSLPEPGTLDGLGVNIHFTEPQLGELEMIRAAGFRWVRMDFTWAATEPEPGRYDFAKYDSLLAALEKANLRAYFILDYGHPKYARPAAPGDAGDRQPFTSRAGTQEFRDAFAKWAVAAVGHFKGRGIVWELWNEPNIAHVVPPSGGTNRGGGTNSGKEDQSAGGDFVPPKGGTTNYIALAKTVAAALEKAGLRGRSRAFPTGTKREAAGECLVGPATSVIDLPFLDACFAAGLLEVFDAISVHPYRQGAPESVAEEYRALRLLIRRHCAADALPLGTYDPSRPNPARRIPILSGEWGYSAAWPSLGKDEAAREATQAKYLPRMFLTNVANDIPLSIWYDWRDDGDDPKEAEHRFGIVRRKPTGDAKQPFEPKPAYTAMKTLAAQLDGMKFSKQLGSWDAPVLLFGRGEDTRQVAWLRPDAKPGWQWPLGFNAPGSIMTLLGKTVTEAERIALTRSDAPYYVTCMDAPTQELARVILAWERLPLEFVVHVPEKLAVRYALRNPLNQHIAYEFAWRGPDEILMCGVGAIGTREPRSHLKPGETTSDVLEFDVRSRRSGGNLRQLLCVRTDKASRATFRQTVPELIMNSLDLDLLPDGKNTTPVLVKNPSGEPFDGSVGIRWEAVQAVAKFNLQRGQTEAVVEVPHGSGQALISPVTLYLSDLSTSWRDTHLRHFDRVEPFTPKMLSFSLDGDPKVKAEAKLEPGNGVKSAPGQTESVCVKYQFERGWKFLSLGFGYKMPLPRDLVYGGTPILGMWVYGDGKGCQPRIRFLDSTGQTFQSDGPKIDWKGWRFVTFPMGPTAMKPLAHWGGAADGKVHHPTKWDSVFLLDNVSREAVEGVIFLSAPTVFY